MKLALQRALSKRWRELRDSGFAANIAATYATRTAIMILGLVSTVVISRWLGPEGRGFYAVAVAIATIGVQFGNFGLHASSSFYVAKSRDLLPQLLANAVLIAVCCGSFAAGVAALILHHWPQIAPLPRTAMIIALVWMPVGLGYLLLQNLLLGANDIGAYNRIELSSKVVAVLALFALIYFGVLSPGWFVAASFSAVAFSAVWAFLRLKKDCPGLLSPSVALLKAGAGMGMRAYAVMFLSFLVLRIDLLMVNRMRGPADAGYYSVAATMADYVAMLPAVVASLLFPKLVSTSDAAQRRTLTRKVAVLTGAVLFLTVVIATFLTRPAVLLLFGPAFAPAVPAFIWLMPGMLFLGIETVVVQLINSYGYPSFLLYLWGLCCLLNIALNLWAIPKFGISGASIVSSICYGFTCVAVLLALRFVKLEESGWFSEAAKA